MDRFEDIEWRIETTGVSADDLRGFFVGWPSPPDAKTHLRILQNSAAISLAVEAESGRVVGFANAISDGVLSAYIPLLEVLPEWQGRGIGRAVIERLCDQLDHLYMVDLICDEELEAFYAPLGFSPSTGMIKRNYENQGGAPPA